MGVTFDQNFAAVIRDLVEKQAATQTYSTWKRHFKALNSFNSKVQYEFNNSAGFNRRTVIKIISKQPGQFVSRRRIRPFRQPWMSTSRVNSSKIQRSSEDERKLWSAERRTHPKIWEKELQIASWASLTLQLPNYMYIQWSFINSWFIQWQLSVIFFSSAFLVASTSRQVFPLRPKRPLIKSIFLPKPFRRNHCSPLQAAKIHTDGIYQLHWRGWDDPDELVGNFVGQCDSI